MAVNPSNAVYFGQGPVAGGSGILAFGGSSMQELSYIGTATFTGDGAATSFFLQWIDGTNALPFTPTGVIAFRTGGNTTATQSVVSVNAISNTQCTVNFSAAPGNGNTALVAFIALK